jgi:hypothetical protein
MSFEKDPEFGGMKIETALNEESDLRTLIIGLSSLYIVILAVVIIVYSKEINTLVYKRPEQVESVKVTGKRTVFRAIGPDQFYIVAFKFSDGTVKELQVGIGPVDDESFGRDFYDTIHENDTGILTFKERKSIEEKIKDENLHWKGRFFIRFERIY